GHFASRQAFLDALLDAWEHRSTDDVLARVEEEGGDARAKVRRAGMLTFSQKLLPIDLAVRDWARRDRSVAKRLRRVDNNRMEYLRAKIGTFSDDPDEVAAQGMLAFSLAIGSHFIAAEHAGRRRADLIACLSAASRGGDPRTSAVGKAKRLGVLETDTQGAVDVAFAPGRVAEDVIGGVSPPLTGRQHDRKLERGQLDGRVGQP